MTILADRADPLTDAAVQKSPILSVRDLRVEFATAGGVVRAVDGVSWTAHAGEIMALVGESGCGKSATAAALTRLLPGRTGRIAGGSAMFDGKDLLSIPDREMRAIRGRDIGMVFQEPMTALNPALRIGPQIEEPLRIHGMATQARARERALELMRLVGISDPERRYDQYPHHLSGGMRQRVLIAMALICDPRLIIADEPTTALDVTIQAQILDLMRDLVQRLGIALVLITHNLGIVARYADRLNVMYAGKIVESGPVDAVFANPGHPYSRGLIRSVPRLDIGREERLATIEGLPPDLSNPPAGCRFAPRCAHRTEACAVEPLLSRFGPDSMAACWHAGIAARPAPSRPAELRTTAKGAGALVLDNVAKHFVMSKGQVVRAVDGVSFEVGAGRTLGLVGESGCGKTTVGRMILGFAKPTDGMIALDGNTIAGDNAVRHPRRWKSLQVVFQDPFSSLNPRMTVGGIIAEPIRVHGLRKTKRETDERIDELLSLVSLPASVAKRYPHQLSGGQRQRIGIARALAHEPEFLVLDEPVSALDVSVQGQIVNLLSDLQERLGLGYLFIAHDLAVVRHLSHDVAVMYLGRIVEIGTREQIYETPRHPYTRALLDAVPIPDPETERMRKSQTLGGEIPSPLAPPPGCAFHTRCPLATAECRETVPALRRLEDGRAAACIKL